MLGSVHLSCNLLKSTALSTQLYNKISPLSEHAKKWRHSAITGISIRFAVAQCNCWWSDFTSTAIDRKTSTIFLLARCRINVAAQSVNCPTTVNPNLCNLGDAIFTSIICSYKVPCKKTGVERTHFYIRLI